ncbi:MAG TPA: phosphatase PAP2 family protein [Terracidiphilus sp.]|nr:phosphatase PAP2 family protein [Terracidiphilus sp.]
MSSIPLLNLAIIGFVTLVAGICLMFRPRDRRFIGLFLTAFLTGVEMMVNDLVLGMLSLAEKVRYDQYVFRIDQFFGQPSFALGRWVQLHPALWTPCLYAYDLLPSAFLAVAAAYFLWAPIEASLRYVWTLLLTAALAPLVYLLVPVSGPKYAFAAFPISPPPSLSPHLIQLTAPPNGMPSVHMAGALLMLYFARRWMAGSILGWIYVLLTIVSTLGTGEHYALDLIAAVPYAMLMIYLMAPGRNQTAGPPSADLRAIVDLPEMKAEV